MTDWAKVDTVYEQEIAPVLAKYGGTLVAKHYPMPTPEPLRKWPPMVTVEFRGEKLQIESNDISSPKSFHDFLLNFDRFAKIELAMRSITDPFYSNISEYIKSEFGRTRFDTNYGFCWICDKIQASGRRIWS